MTSRLIINRQNINRQNFRLSFIKYAPSNYFIFLLFSVLISSDWVLLEATVEAWILWFTLWLRVTVSRQDQRLWCIININNIIVLLLLVGFRIDYSRLYKTGWSHSVSEDLVQTLLRQIWSYIFTDWSYTMYLTLFLSLVKIIFSIH